MCIVNPTSDNIDLTHGPWTNGLWPGTLFLLALHAEQLQWIHFQLDQYSILMWLESVDGRCWWRNVVVICCYCWIAIYSNLWELKLATLLKVTTYDFKADLFVTDSSGQALHDEKVTKCLHIQKLREILLHCYSKNIRFMEIFRLFEFCWVLFTFWGNLSSYPFGGRFPDRNNMWCFSEVSTAAPRYSSLEADEFDEGSAAEEADASVTRSSWSGGRLWFLFGQKPIHCEQA